MPNEHKRKFKALRQLVWLMMRYPLRVLGALTGVILSTILTLSVGEALKTAVDGLVSGKGELTPEVFIFAVVFFFLLLAIASAMRLYFIGWVGERVMADLRVKIHRHILSQPPAFFELRRTADLIGRITTDSVVIQTLIVSTGSMALRNSMVVILSIVLMIVESLTLSATLFLTLPLMMAVIFIYSRKVRNLSRASQQSLADVGSHTEQSLSGIRVIQAYGHESIDLNQFSKKVERNFSISRKRLLMRATLTALVLVSVMFFMGLMIGTGIDEIKAGRLSAGEFSAFIFYAFLMAATSGVLSESISDVMRAAGAADRLFSILASDEPIKKAKNPRALPSKIKGTIEFKNLTFTYPSGQKARALHEFNLTIKGGEHIALVGPSGAGKSTLLLLLLRFYDYQAGELTLDGHPIDQFELSSLRNLFAFVPQEATIFAGSLRDNLRYAKYDASDKELSSAIQKAALDKLVAALPDGLDTQVGERGLLLSGGERQRLGLARAFLRQPHIILLDEPTSALDSEHEAEVALALDALSKNRTSITIAHRLSTIQNAGRIIVMDKGKMVAHGTDQELVKNSPLYARLKALQFRSLSS